MSNDPRLLCDCMCMCTRVVGGQRLVRSMLIDAVVAGSDLVRTSGRSPLQRRSCRGRIVSAALTHLPSGHFGANGAWLVCAAISHNLTRAAGTLASSVHARARTGTIRAQLIHTPTRANGLALRLSPSLLPAETWNATTPPTVLRQGHCPHERPAPRAEVSPSVPRVLILDHLTRLLLVLDHLARRR